MNTRRPDQTTVHASAEDARIARLVGLAEVWGAVKYFHPFLAYREIDWDKALVETIPKVNGATTPQEYQEAVNHMLAVLSDGSTRAEIEPDTNPTPLEQTTNAEKELMRTETGVLVIHAMQIAQTGAQDRAAFDGLIDKINEAIPAATAVVIDGRGPRRIDDWTSYFFRCLLLGILPKMLDANITLGSVRYRMHNGYTTQTGIETGGYYSAFGSVSPKTIHGQNKGKTPPIVFVINQNTPEVTEVLSGLQWARCAFVVQEGEQAREASSGIFTMELVDRVSVRIGVYECLNPNGSVGFQPDAVVPKNAGADTVMREAMQAVRGNRIGQTRRMTAASFTPQVGQHDKPYAEMEFPGSEYRLLALFRFWNVIHYFFPYKDFIGDSWKTVLPRYIPKFEANKNAVEYQLTVHEMVAELHDSHGWVQNSNASAETLGMFVPPVLLRYVENQTVVTGLLDDRSQVKIGDVILTVDGQPIEERRAFLSRFIAASTPQGLMRTVHWDLLRGQKDSVTRLQVSGMDGGLREVALTRSVPANDPKLFAARQRSIPAVQVLPSGYGYVDLARLQVGGVDEMFETIKATPAVIFDMRGYPNGTAWAIAPRLTEKTTPIAALFSRPFLEARSLGDPDLTEGTSYKGANYTFAQRLPERKGDVFNGKVVMLINEEAISQAEHTCLFFESATNVTFIGTPTVGANGDITYMVLPGNLTVSFTGHNVRHADGRQLQRVGIQPAIRVEPTIRGVIAGRDEILERAVAYLQENLGAYAIVFGILMVTFS